MSAINPTSAVHKRPVGARIIPNRVAGGVAGTVGTAALGGTGSPVAIPPPAEVASPAPAGTPSRVTGVATAVPVGSTAPDSAIIAAGAATNSPLPRLPLDGTAAVPPVNHARNWADDREDDVPAGSTAGQGLTVVPKKRFDVFSVDSALRAADPKPEPRKQSDQINVVSSAQLMGLCGVETLWVVFTFTRDRETWTQAIIMGALGFEGVVFEEVSPKVIQAHVDIDLNETPELVLRVGNERGFYLDGSNVRHLKIGRFDREDIIKIDVEFFKDGEPYDMRAVARRSSEMYGGGQGGGAASGVNGSRPDKPAYRGRGGFRGGYNNQRGM